jgi:TATA-box binding protein (TBP) (component of TFIID and TFIIIB)
MNKINNSKKVLIWKSWGHVSVYALESESQYLKAIDELLECCKVGGFEYESKNHMNLQEVVRWINFQVADDWDLFEYLAIEEVQESVPTRKTK